MYVKLDIRYIRNHSMNDGNYRFPPLSESTAEWSLARKEIPLVYVEEFLSIPRTPRITNQIVPNTLIVQFDANITSEPLRALLGFSDRTHLANRCTE